MRIILVFLVLFFISCAKNLTINHPYLMTTEKFKGNPKMIQSTDYSVGENEELIERSVITYHFDKNGKPVKTVFSEGAQVSSEWHFIYDKKKRLMQKKIFKDDGTPNGRISFLYNTKKMLTEIIFEGAESCDTLRKTIYTYNKKKNEILTKSKDKDSIISQEIRKIVKKDNHYEVFHYEIEDGKSNLIFKDELNQNRQKIKSTWFVNDSINSYTVYQYNEYGDILKTNSFRIVDNETIPSNSTFIKYKYDKFANKVKEELIINGKIISIIEYKIEYY